MGKKQKRQKGTASSDTSCGSALSTSTDPINSLESTDLPGEPIMSQPSVENGTEKEVTTPPEVQESPNSWVFNDSKVARKRKNIDKDYVKRKLQRKTVNPHITQTPSRIALAVTGNATESTIVQDISGDGQQLGLESSEKDCAVKLDRTGPMKASNGTSERMLVQENTSECQLAMPTATNTLTIDDLHIAVATEPLKKLSKSQAENIRSALTTKLLADILGKSASPPAVAPSFRGKPFLSGGVLKMWCEDKNALDWLSRTVTSIPSPIPDTNLVVRRQKDLIKRVQCSLRIPNNVSVNGEKTQKLLIAQNPWYSADEWALISSHKLGDGGWNLILEIPEKQIPVILQRQSRVSFALGSIYFMLPERVLKQARNDTSSN